MVPLQRVVLIIFVFSFLVANLGISSAWEFNGTVKDVDGNLLNNTLVNVTVWQMGGPTGMSLVGANFTTTNASGWFNLSVSESSDWMYSPVLTQTNATTGAIDYIGQSLPKFPYREFVNTSDLNFYLKTAGTINITAINKTADRITFRYQVKDTTLGYPIAESFSDAVSEAIIKVPRDRNYSVMIYPDQAIPVSFNWNNFSSSSSYDIVTGLATYNATTHTVQKTFNSTDNLIRITGYVKNLSNSTSWNEFTVVPFLLEPGNMIYLGDNAGMPYNMSAWNNQQSDLYNLTTGFYNITLPGPAESANYILFATARNATNYCGGYKNISLSYSSTSVEVNITEYPLMSIDWASANNNISLNDAVAWTKVNISSSKQKFNLINSSGSIISNLNAHLEVKLDYTNYGAQEFTIMADLSSGNASFYLPLLNASVKEMNIFSRSYSPKTVATKTAAQILNNSNITMTTFNPGDIDGRDIMASVQVALYNSNSTCDVPNPASACIMANSASMDPDAADRFNPLSSVIGGGKLSFRMGLLSSGIIVEYVNVDMLASGPPDALFDDSATTSTSAGFDSAMRFGSNGPKIYDYVLISMPYTEGSASQTGLNESTDVNMTIPILYDESWNVIWNSTLNGTNGGALAGNYTHYTTRSTEWQTLMGQNNCTRNQSELNSTNPCFLDTANNRIWVRIPHFSGTQPNVIGSVVTATTSTSSSTSSGGSSASASFWTLTYAIDDTKFKSTTGYSREMGVGGRVTFKIGNESHGVGVMKVNTTTATINVSSVSQVAILTIGELKNFDVNNDSSYDVSVRLNGINTTSAGANFTINYLSESTVNASADSPGEITGAQTGVENGNITSLNASITKIIIIIIALIIIVAVLFYLFYGRKWIKQSKVRKSVKVRDKN